LALDLESAQGNVTLATARTDSDAQTLRECLRARLSEYFVHIDGQAPGDLYGLVMAEVEAPLFQMVLEHTRGNLSRSAEILGIHRATLRRKLGRYGLL